MVGILFVRFAPPATRLIRHAAGRFLWDYPMACSVVRPMFKVVGQEDALDGLIGESNRVIGVIRPLELDIEPVR